VIRSFARHQQDRQSRRVSGASRLAPARSGSPGAPRRRHASDVWHGPAARRCPAIPRDRVQEMKVMGAGGAARLLPHRSGSAAERKMPPRPRRPGRSARRRGQRARAPSAKADRPRRNGSRAGAANRTTGSPRAAAGICKTPDSPRDRRARQQGQPPGTSRAERSGSSATATTMFIASAAATSPGATPRGAIEAVAEPASDREYGRPRNRRARRRARQGSGRSRDLDLSPQV
jgi:hypothetical protein